MTTGGRDFPYYNGQPVLITGRGWMILMAALVLAFAALVAVPRGGFPLSLIPALLFLGIPMVALRLVAGQGWRALFRPVRAKDIALMVLFGGVTVFGSILIGMLLMRLGTMATNPLAGEMAALSFGGLVMVLIPTIPQLIGEEFLGILPFLAALWFCTARLGLSRWAGIGIGLVISALIFGAAHLPTYDWNWQQCLVGIGTARVLLTLAFLVTKNLWVSAGAHIVNDWSEFLLSFAAGHVPIGE